MARMIRFIAISVALAFLTAGSAQAASWKMMYGAEKVPMEKGLIASVWEWFHAWMAGTSLEPGGITAIVGADGSQLDPNGGH